MCPGCGTTLLLPPGCANCFVRCSHCRCRFRLPRRIRVSEETITDWLSVEEDDDEAPDERAAGAAAPTEPQVSSGGTSVLPAIHHEGIRLLRADAQGALLEFAAGRLREHAFRSAMPRRCLHCGVRKHLHVHVILYAAQFASPISQQAEYSAGALSVSEDEAQTLSNDEILRRLPAIPNVPSPANLPMPYWLCDLCAGADPVRGQIQVNPETGVGWCRLLIRSLRRAEEFLLAAGGAGTAAHEELRQSMATLSENPWDSLPLLVQNRLSQWFRPEPEERLLAYVPDRDHARTEDGMAGLVVSSHRLICHTPLRHRESPVRERLELSLSMGGHRGNVRIRAAEWEVKHFAIDLEGLNRLRTALATGKYRALWI